MKYNAIILTGFSNMVPRRSIGAYRIRTVIEHMGYTARVIEHADRISDEVLTKLLDSFVGNETLFIGISSTFLQPVDVQRFAKLINIKQLQYSNIQFVLGGARTHLNTNIGADAIISGYSDSAIVEYMNYIDNKPHQLIYENYTTQKNKPYIHINGNKNYKDVDMHNLRTIWKDEDDINSEDALPIEISRGCIFKCSFCYFPLNGKAKFDYFRSVDELAAEMQYNYDMFGVTSYSFLDDTFNDSREKIQFLDDVLRRLNFKIKYSVYIKPELLVSWPETQQQLVEQGLESAVMGVESFNTVTRKHIGKGMPMEKIDDAVINMRRYGNGQLSTAYNMIVGLPFESIDSTLESYKYIKEAEHIDTWHWNILGIQSLKDPNITPSLIDAEPERYGYTITHDDGIKRLWKNEHTTFDEGKKIRDWLDADGFNYRRMGGWVVPLIRNANIDVSKHICKTVYKDFDWTDMRQKINQRVKKYVERQLQDV